MIRLQRYRSALKCLVPIVFHTFFTQESPYCAEDEVVEELDMGFYLNDQELEALKRDAVETFLTGFEKDLMSGPMGIGRNDAMLLGELLAFARSFQSKNEKSKEG